jgi:hypothetical protein
VPPIYPSAMVPGAANLVVFVDMLRAASRLQIVEVPS